jgi:FAD-dependent oxidoreductase family protein
VRVEHVTSDLTVIGGGLAGVCAAIAAARQGATVSLVQNRPVLGGNSSSEIRVWVCGATAHGVQQYARETGIMGELWLRNQAINPDGNPYYWDLVVLEAVRAEPNITLFLNTDIRDAEVNGPPQERTIRSVTGWMMGSERLITFTSQAFCDCTGDGYLGYLAGADHLTGRESRDVYGESWAPEVPDSTTLGSTILFYTKDAGHPVGFVAPSFAVDIERAGIPEHRLITPDQNGCSYWWIEWGGELDIVHDDARIRDELQGVIYGIWDYIKNSGKFAADNLTLEWIGAVPGKREYRRFLGDYVLTQHDVLNQTEFDDRAGFGGWSIDLHPAGGVYATEPGSRHWHPDGNYHLPLRSLYSRNVTNLWMAGRNISASHVAFGSTRVMATCAVTGEAAGLGAAVALGNDLTPRRLATEQLELFQRALTRSDASVLGLVDTDPANQSLTATAKASSTLREVCVEGPIVAAFELESAVGVVLPVAPGFESLELLVEADADTEIVVTVHATDKAQVYLPGSPISSATVPVTGGRAEWIEVPVKAGPEGPANVFVVIEKNPLARLQLADHSEPGILVFRHRDAPPDEIWTEQFRHWKLAEHRRSVCLRTRGDLDVYDARHVIGGYARPYAGPNMWVSAPLTDDPGPWIELRWSERVTLTELTVVLDDSLDIDLINLHRHKTEFDTMPGLLTDYTIQAQTAEGWIEVAVVTGNQRRKVRHLFQAELTAEAIRLVARATGGDPHAHVVSLRAY